MSSSYFGEDWGALALQDLEQSETPVGRPCLYCFEPIEEGEEGFIRIAIGLNDVHELPIHRECDLRAVIGSVGHQRHTCSCYQSPGDDQEDGLSRREAALAATREFEGEHRSWTI